MESDDHKGVLGRDAEHLSSTLDPPDSIQAEYRLLVGMIDVSRVADGAWRQ